MSHDYIYWWFGLYFYAQPIYWHVYVNARLVHIQLVWKYTYDIEIDTPRRGIEPRSSAWQAEILSTILTRIAARHMSTSRWRYRKSQRITKAIKIHHLPTMHVYTTFWANPSSWCCNVVKSSPSGGAKEKVRGSPKSLLCIVQGPWRSVVNFIAIHSMVVEIIHSEPQMSTSW